MKTSEEWGKHLDAEITHLLNNYRALVPKLNEVIAEIQRDAREGMVDLEPVAMHLREGINYLQQAQRVKERDVQQSYIRCGIACNQAALEGVVGYFEK